MGAELLDLTVHIDTGRWSETVVDSVDVVVPDGQLTALLGGPGSGKSIVVAALSGLLPASATVSGQARVNGSAIETESKWQELRSATLGCVPQEAVTAFDPADTIGEQLRGLERTHGRWSVERACGAARYPAGKLDLYPHQVSAGEAKRAALAAALLTAPAVLLVDEPSAALDFELKYAVWETLREYADAGAAVLAVTNDVAILAATCVADQLVVMDNGRVFSTGSSVDALGWPDVR
ncbi:ATP-binding cassette domain-containing protein [Nocardioidaceae bacterium SCSIO 66511]|nr:ATP-binding cassette domain-containing protein [Nocardioidaceae bacterium SCSIO 66511]